MYHYGAMVPSINCERLTSTRTAGGDTSSGFGRCLTLKMDEIKAFVRSPGLRLRLARG
jgi:hypothetical protein